MVKPVEKHIKVLTGPPRSTPSRVFHKTVICKYFSSHGCLKGQSCTFAHGSREKIPVPDLRYTQMCRALVQQGVCEDPACTYAHKKEDVRGMLTPPLRPGRAGRQQQQPAQGAEQPRQQPAKQERGGRHGKVVPPVVEGSVEHVASRSKRLQQSPVQPPIQPPPSDSPRFEASDDGKHAGTGMIGAIARGGTISLEPALSKMPSDAAPPFWPSTQGDRDAPTWKKAHSPKLTVCVMDRQKSMNSTDTGGTQEDLTDAAWPAVYGMVPNSDQRGVDLVSVTPDPSPVWWPGRSWHSGTTPASSDTDGPGDDSATSAQGRPPCELWPVDFAMPVMTPDVSPMPWRSERAATFSAWPKGSDERPSLQIFSAPQKFMNDAAAYQGVFGPIPSGGSTTTYASSCANLSPISGMLNILSPTCTPPKSSTSNNFERRLAAAAEGDGGVATVNVKNTFLQFSSDHAEFGCAARRPTSLPPRRP